MMIIKAAVKRVHSCLACDILPIVFHLFPEGK